MIVLRGRGKLYSVLLLSVIAIEVLYIISNYEFPCSFKFYSKEISGINTDILQMQVSRKQALFNYCKSKKEKENRATNYLIYSDEEKLLYCYVPKVASTTWKRLFQVFEGQLSFENASKYDKNDIHDLPYNRFINLKRDNDQSIRERTYYSFLITRHPFERLVATYRNKFEDPYTPYFQKAYGSRILRKYRKRLNRDQYAAGVGVTFHEFIKFILSSRVFEEHWSKMTDLCLPCSYKYDYIAKMETLVNDSKAILEITGLTEKYPFLENASDRYEKKSRDLLEEYFNTIPLSDIEKLYSLYIDDFLAFGYSIPNFIKIEESLTTLRTNYKVPKNYKAPEKSSPFFTKQLQNNQSTGRNVYILHKRPQASLT